MALNFRNFGQRLLDSTTLDEKIGGAFKTAAKTGRQWGQELKQGFIPAVKQTAPTVAQDFGNMFRNTFKNVPVLKTAGNIVGDFGQRAGSSIVDVAQGAYRTAQRPDLLGKAQGVAQTIRGVGKGLVTAMPVTPFIDIAANTGKSDSLSRRLATGYSRGISQIPELAPNTQAKNVNIGKLSFDPAMMGAEMVGFVKNPINKKLFEATNKLIPSAEKSLKLWLATTASRGGLENILLAMPEMPEKMSTIQKAQWMATNAGIGAAQEIVGQGIVKGLSKAGGAIADSKAGKYTAEQLAKQFDNLNEFKRKATIPVSKPGFGPKLGQTITEPMWKWEMGLVDDGSMKQYNSEIDAPKLSVEPTGKLDAQTLKEYESIKNSEYFSDNKNLAKSLIELENFKDTTTYKALDQLRKDRGIKDVYSEAVAKSTTPEAIPIKQVDLKGFGEKLDPKNKSRATILLSGKTRIDGGSEVITKAEKIEKLLGQGYKPETINGKPVLKNASGNFYEVTKIESDYAKHLSQSSPLGGKVGTIKGVTSKSRTDLPLNTRIDTQQPVAQIPDTTKQTVKLSKDINVKSNASEPIIPKSASPDEVASTIPQRLDNFINKTLGYSTQAPTGGTKTASMWTRGIRGVENKLTTGVEKAMGSENNLVRNAATNLQNFFRGTGMSPERANASMDLRGGIATANERAYNVMDSLYKSLNNDKASLERINAVLDPELAKTKIKFADLSDTEKQVYGIIREGLDLVHDTSYANGHISSELYQANKGKYTPRLYEVMELPAEVNKFVTQGSKKINNDLYKQRTETNDWKLENSLNDPVYALGKRLSQVETNSAIKKYTDFLSSNQRLVSDVERPGFTKLSDSPAYGALSGKYVLNSAAEDLKGFFFANQAVQNLYDVFKAYDRLPIRQLQKKLLTVFNPTTNVGNIVSDQVFGFVTGVDPLTLNKNLIQLKSNPSSFKQLSDYLMSKGINGTDITRSDFVNKLSSIDELAQGKKPGVLKGVADKITSFYGGTDDAYKVAAFKSLLDKGFTLEEATRKVADGFQNYSNVGKFYDVWAKTPIVGSAFIKFQGDLMRIIKNGAVNNPLGLISFLGTLWGVARLSSKLSGETDENREARENRFGAPMIPGLKIPLTWQTPIGEINAARYISPFFANNEVTNLAKMLPFVPTINTKKDVASNIAINANDPLLSPAINLLVNRDFRGKAIADPNENKYQPSTLTPGEQNLNRLKFAGRAYTPPPINSLIDVKAAAEGKPNMYGAKQSVPQAVARLAGIKVQKYGPEEVKAQKAKDAEFAQYANESIDKQINSVYKQELLGEITTKQMETRIKALEEQKKPVGEVKTKEIKTTDKTTGFADIPVYRYIDDNGSMQTIDITKPLETPKLTGQTEVDKKLVSAYKGKITSRINDIVKLVEAGKIEPAKAEEMIKTLKATQSKLTGGKKPKKITIKYTKAPKVSFKLSKPTKMSVIKAPTSKRARISFKNYKPAKIKV